MVSEALAIASPPRMPIPLGLCPDKGICKGLWGHGRGNAEKGDEVDFEL